MSDLVNELASRTGLSPELVQKGMGALLSFIKKELGEETFDKISTSIPQASAYVELRVGPRAAGRSRATGRSI